MRQYKSLLSKHNCLQASLNTRLKNEAGDSVRVPPKTKLLSFVRVHAIAAHFPTPHRTKEVLKVKLGMCSPPLFAALMELLDRTTISEQSVLYFERRLHFRNFSYTPQSLQEPPPFTPSQMQESFFSLSKHLEDH